MTSPLLYDPEKTFEDNLNNGPFNFDQTVDKRDDQTGSYKFLGHTIASPFGIAAGSLPTSRHTTAAFKYGFDVVCYKTQRSGSFPTNDFPNVLPIAVNGDLTLEKLSSPLVVLDSYPENLNELSITNSFGVPSRDPDVWIDDVHRAVEDAGKHQLLIMSVVGTIKPGFGPSEYYDDFAIAAKEAKQAGAKAIEINLSCPNVASEGVICYSADAVTAICERTKRAIGITPLIIKVGYYSAEQQGLLEDIVARIAPFVSAISAINTLPASIVGKDGNQALPGEGRLRSGVCGAGIKWAGLDLVKRLDDLRRQKSYGYEIIGVGGVMTAEDFFEYRRAGADVVQSVTGAMWDAELAQKIKAKL